MMSIESGFNSESESHIESCKPEIYENTKVPWDEIKADILGIELSVFGDENAFEEEDLKKDFENPKSVVVLLRDQNTNKIVRFTYAEPTKAVYLKEDYPNRKPNYDTAYISDSAILKDYQNKGLIGPMMEFLEEQLTQRGFNFMERDSDNNKDPQDLTTETYADKVRKKYKDRIILQERHESEYGPQGFFRIDLKKQED